MSEQGRVDDTFAAPHVELAGGFPAEAPQPRGYPPQPAIQANGSVSGNDIHLLDYVRVLYKRRWSALTAFLIVLLTVTVYTFTATPIYEARVQLLIEPENP